MNIHTNPTKPLRSRMTDDMISRGLGTASQRNKLHACEPFLGWFVRLLDTVQEDVKRFQQHLVETTCSILPVQPDDDGLPMFVSGDLGTISLGGGDFPVNPRAKSVVKPSGVSEVF